MARISRRNTVVADFSRRHSARSAVAICCCPLGNPMLGINVQKNRRRSANAMPSRRLFASGRLARTGVAFTTGAAVTTSSARLQSNPPLTSGVPKLEACQCYEFQDAEARPSCHLGHRTLIDARSVSREYAKQRVNAHPVLEIRVQDETAYRTTGATTARDASPAAGSNESARAIAHASRNRGCPAPDISSPGCRP
jgi:hypothetical protein